MIGNRPSSRTGDGLTHTEEATLRIGKTALSGYLTVPTGSSRVVVFAHGSGSSRHSPRNLHVASVLNREGFATLLFDLLTTREELDRGNVFDIPLLGARLAEVSGWVRGKLGTDSSIGYFGASTGAGAALWAASRQPEIAAVVSRGGRPDLAGPALADVTAPTLLIVGGRDHAVLNLNREAQAKLGGESALEIVPGATHLFEEPGALDRVADLACGWFEHHLPTKGPHLPGVAGNGPM